MNLPRPLAMLCPLLAVACSDDAILQNDGGAYRVVHQADAKWRPDSARTEMAAALAHTTDINIVFAHDDEMAAAAALACQQLGRTGVRFVGIGGSADRGRRYVAEGLLAATVECPTGAAVAIDMVLLAMSLGTVPQRLDLGPRLYTKATLATGGTLVPGPSEFVLENLRRQHAEVLTTTPVIDVVFRIGLADCEDGDAWRSRARDELKSAAKRYPQLQLDCRVVGDGAEGQLASIRYFMEQNYNVICVAPKDPSQLAAVCREARAQGIKVVVLGGNLDSGPGDQFGSDDYTCFIGADQVACGRAAGRAIQTMLPKGGAIVEIQGAMTSAAAQQRHRGFTEALGLRRP